MKKLLVMLTFAALIFALSSCSDDGIVVKLHYLNAKGKYETVKIKKFENGEKLSDRIDSAKTDFYKEKDKERYDEATADVVLESDYKVGETVVFAKDAKLSFTGWSTKAQGETGSADWNTATALTEDVEVYAQYSEAESVSLSMRVTGLEPIEGGDPKVGKSFEASVVDAERNATVTYTVTLVNATLKGALTAEQVKALVSVTENTEHEFTTAPEITGNPAGAGAAQIAFDVLFTGEAAPSASAEDLVKSGVVKFEIASSALTVAEGYYASEKVSESLNYELTYEKKAYVGAVFTTTGENPIELSEAINNGNPESNTVDVDVIAPVDEGVAKKHFQVRIVISGSEFAESITDDNLPSYVKAYKEDGTTEDEEVEVGPEFPGEDKNIILVDVSIPAPAEIGVEGVTVRGTLKLNVTKAGVLTDAAEGYEFNGDSITASLPYSITFIAD